MNAIILYQLDQQLILKLNKMIPITPKKGELYTPPLPAIEYPKWLPTELKLYIDDHINMLCSLKFQPRRIFDGYSLLVKRFNKIKSIFTHNDMNDIWLDLYKKSPELSTKLVYTLLQIENDFDHINTLIAKHKGEIASSRSIIKHVSKLITALKNDHYWYYGHMQLQNENEYYELLKQYKQGRIDNLNAFIEDSKKEKSISDSHWPLSRKREAENALSIFFIRKLYVFFKKTYKKPMYKYVTVMVNTAFNTTYTENEIIKFCRPVKINFSDDSAK